MVEHRVGVALDGETLRCLAVGLRCTARGAVGALGRRLGAGQRVGGEHHVLVAEHVVRVQFGTLDELHIGEVEEALDGGEIVAIDHHEHLALQTERRERSLGQLGLRLFEAPRVDDDHFAGSRTVGQSRTQRQVDHLLRGLLAVLTRLGPEGHATAAEVRCTGGALTSVTGALLLERLLTATRHFGTGLGALGTGTTSGELSGDHLVHHRNVRLDAEHVVGQFEIADGDAGGAFHGYGRHVTSCPSLRCGR